LTAGFGFGFCLVLFEPRFCQTEETELARPAAAPVTAEVAAEKPPVAGPEEEEAEPEGGADGANPAAGADGADCAVIVASLLVCHADAW
jgi:hypothetical protein